MTADRPKRILRFGAFEADPTTGELRKAGMRVRLQDQPFAVLMILLERAGELVTREELRQRLWPADTFVDFDHGLNTVINKLREALGDSATSPRFIETLARRGYRFLGTVETVENGTAAAPVAETVSTAAPPGNAASPQTPSAGMAVLTQPEEVPPLSRRYARALFALLQVMYLIFYVVALARLTHVEALLRHLLGHAFWPETLLVVTAVAGVPIRLYLLAGAAFDIRSLSAKFQRLLPVVFALDELWALAPFLLLPQIGLGLALAATAALIYAPFSQRTLLLMGDRSAPAAE
jgi:DNA-binding winged helix-turn-helix (wHTH) protein